MTTPAILIVYGNRATSAKLIAELSTLLEDFPGVVHQYLQLSVAGIDANISRVKAKNVILVGKTLIKKFADISDANSVLYQVQQRNYLGEPRKFLFLPSSQVDDERFSKAVDYFKELAE